MKITKLAYTEFSERDSVHVHCGPRIYHCRYDSVLGAYGIFCDWNYLTDYMGVILRFKSIEECIEHMKRLPEEQYDEA